jgi:tRNA(fMet)-specific endonuclease VapC
MERICLDTNILIDHKRAKPSEKAKTVLFRLASGHYQLAISTITAYELLRGDNQNEDQYWLQMFENLQVLPLDLVVCQTAANVYKNLKRRSLLIEPEDLFIAATALRHGLKLATSNLKHFSRVDGLQLLREADLSESGGG